MRDPDAVLACDLAALSREERGRRSALAFQVSAGFREVQELPDGYAMRLEPDPVVIRDALDWVLLERRCCPFLRIELAFEPTDGPVWLRFRGRSGVKEFLAAAGLARAPS